MKHVLLFYIFKSLLQWIRCTISPRLSRVIKKGQSNGSAGRVEGWVIGLFKQCQIGECSVKSFENQFDNASCVEINLLTF